MTAARSHRAGDRLGRRLLLGALAVVQLTACDALDRALGVEAPSRIPAASLEGPESAELLVQGALADFDCAFASYVVVGGLITDELLEAAALANRWPYDRRDVQPSEARYSTFGCEAIGVYSPLSVARYTADDVLTKLEGWTDAEVEDRTALIATAAAYSGYSHLLLGEGFCSVAIDLGPELTPADVFALAETKFTRAIEAATAAGETETLSLARVGRARARLNLGRYADAATDARLVPEGFEAFAEYSNASGRRQNRVYVQNQLSNSVSVGPEYRNMTFAGVPDPRVEVVDDGDTGVFDETPIWATTKYTSEASPIRIASWDEAQLIVAEAELRAGNAQAATDIINVLHARAGIPSYGGGDAATVLAQLVEERRRALFLESHRLYDVNRFDVPLVPAPGTQYPQSGTYGDLRCLPLPDIERANNPNF